MALKTRFVFAAPPGWRAVMANTDNLEDPKAKAIRELPIISLLWVEGTEGPEEKQISLLLPLACFERGFQNPLPMENFIAIVEPGKNLAEYVPMATNYRKHLLEQLKARRPENLDPTSPSGDPHKGEVADGEDRGSGGASAAVTPGARATARP